jgi:nitrate reductase gamma subunit
MALQASVDAVSAASTATAAASTSPAAGADAVSAASSAAAAHTGFALVVDRIDYAVMVPLVYVSLLALLVGIIWRIAVILRSPPPPYPLRLYPSARRPVLAALADALAMPQVRRRRPLFWACLVVFHAGILALILGHLDILPQVNLMPPGSRHMLGAGGVGVAVTLPLLCFLFRRFRSPCREISVPADYLLLLLLIFLALFGDMMSWGNSWSPHGFVMTKQDFSRYFDGLLRLTFADPRAALPGSHYHFAVIHVALAEAFFIVLPFSKIMHAFLSIPVNLLRRR